MIVMTIISSVSVKPRTERRARCHVFMFANPSSVPVVLRTARIQGYTATAVPTESYGRAYPGNTSSLRLEARAVPYPREQARGGPPRPAHTAYLKGRRRRSDRSPRRL